MVGLQYKIQLSLAKHTNAIVGTILEAPIVIIVCVKMVELVKGKVVSSQNWEGKLCEKRKCKNYGILIETGECNL
jgi:hypothetical protein